MICYSEHTEIYGQNNHPLLPYSEYLPRTRMDIGHHLCLLVLLCLTSFLATQCLLQILALCGACQHHLLLQEWIRNYEDLLQSWGWNQTVWRPERSWLARSWPKNGGSSCFAFHYLGWKCHGINGSTVEVLEHSCYKTSAPKCVFHYSQ